VTLQKNITLSVLLKHRMNLGIGCSIEKIVEVKIPLDGVEIDRGATSSE